VSGISKSAIWKERIEDFRTSNLKAQDWCDKNNLHITTLQQWIRRINKEDITSSNKTVEFVPVTTPSIMIHNTAPIIIRYGKISIDISDDCHPDTLRNILEALRIYA